MKEEIKKKIKELEERLFLLDMVDRWTNYDNKVYERLNKEKRKLEDKLKELEK